MKTWQKWLAAGAVVAAALVSVGADSLRRQEQSLPGPTTQPAIQPATQPSSLALFAGQKRDEWASYQVMHAYILDRFIRSPEGFGVRRMPRVEDEARSRRIYADGTRYLVGRVQLISLNDGKQPFAYLTIGDDVTKKQIKHANRVPLDDATSSALDELKTGKEVVLTGTGDNREFVGAVRAIAACTKCHEVAEGTLLGAFRYPLVEEPRLQQRQLAR